MEEEKKEGVIEQKPNVSILDDARKERELIEDAIKRMSEKTAELNEAMAKMALGGVSDAGQQPEKPKTLTDREYAEALERGEVNPLKDDGLFK